MKGIIAGALLLSLAPHATQQATPAINFTPGTAAQLIGQDEAHATIGVEQALHLPDSSVRLIAARVAATAPLPNSATALLAALAAESNPDVAAEYIHDILLLTGAPGEAAIEPYLRRNSPAAAITYAEWLARIRPEGLASKFADLFSLAPDAGYEFTRIARTSGALHGNARDAVYRAWMKVAPASAWRSLLYQSFSGPGTAVDGTAVLVSALNSARPDIRTETVWFVGGLRDVPDAVLNAALPVDGAPVDWEAFGRELIARSHGHLQTPDRAEFLRTALSNAVFGASNLRVNRTLTDAERAVVASVPASGPTDLDPWFPASAVTPSSIAPSVIEGLFTASRCEPKTGTVGFTVVTYAEDGRPKQIQPAGEGLSAGCQLALTILARLTLEARDHAATEGPQMLVLPFDKDTAACIDDAATTQTQAARPLRVDRRRVQAPDKIRGATPLYPPDAQKQRIEGAVIVEAVIGPRGCVQHARVLRSLSPLTDAPALDAAMRTLFKPPVVEGKPAAVVMTMTVNFQLMK